MKGKDRAMTYESIITRLRCALTFGYPEDGGNGIRWRWSSLNEGPDGRPRGWAWHGRGWLTIRDDASINVEWNLRSRFAHAYVRVDPSDSSVGAAVALPPVALWLTVESRRWRPLFKALGMKHAEREVSVSAHDGSIWWRLWGDPHSWSSATPRWRDGSFNVDNALRGKPVYSSQVLSTTTALIPMPERSYKATVTLTEDTWSRARWWPQRVRRAKIDMIPGEQIPHPGKGENSYDCDEDATYSMGTQARTVGEAIGALVADILDRRERHGGRDWRPAAKAATAEAS